jgi:hypothetical protein
MELKMQVSNNQNFEKFTKKKTAKPSTKLIARKEQKLKTMKLRALRKFIENNND